MKKLITIALLASGIAGCASPKPAPLPKPAVTAEKPAPKQDVIRQSFQLSPEQEQRAKDAVIAKLKDPDSARFSGVVGVGDPNTGSFSVCGSVNAKNSYGGYTGSKPFAVSAGHVLFWASSRDRFAAFDNDMIKLLCTPNR